MTGDSAVPSPGEPKSLEIVNLVAPARLPPATDDQGHQVCPNCGVLLPPAVDYPHEDGMGDIRSWVCDAEGCNWEFEG